MNYEHDHKQQNQINQFFKKSPELSRSLLTSVGYVNLAFSPAAARDKQDMQKLGLVLTFQEWLAIADLIERERQVHWSNLASSECLDYLYAVIKTIPSPE